MKYETLLNNVAADVHYSVINSVWMTDDTAVAALFAAAMAPAPAHATIRHLADEASKIVLRWDVRAIGRLRELFPRSFPRSLRSGRLVADYDQNGDWVICRAP